MKHKNANKILSLVLAIVMVSTMFVSCKSNNNVVNDNNSKSESKAETPEKEITTISWYCWGNPPQNPDAVIEALNKKSAEDIGVKVNFKWQPNDKALKTALAAGDSDIDLAFTCGWFANYVVSAQNNYFADITDKVKTITPTLYKTLPETLWKCVTVNGKIYGVPIWKDTAADLYWMARKDILEAAKATEEFKKAGRSLDSLTPTLEKIKAWHDADPEKNKYSEGNTAPINFSKTGLAGIPVGWDVLEGSTQIGVKIGDNNTTVRSRIIDEETIANWKTLKEWADKGLSNGKVAPQIEQASNVMTVDIGQGWEGAQYTAWGGPSKGYETVIQHLAGPFLGTSSVATAIGANSKNIDATLKYVEYMNTNAEYRNMLAYGVEGTNWEKTGDGQMKKLTGNDWAPGNWSMASFQLLIPEAPAPKDMYKNIVEQVSTANVSPVLGFIPNTEKVKNQITACTSIFTEYIDKLNCGAVADVDATVAELLKKVDKLGYQDIIKEYQSQVDAFLAKK